ncbi:MBL fold metallo-hydrolase [Gordonia hydrophobica]|uniref:MBL fold metallo-hydrolase n=1 Tax=Gordonia hydrophobica TaxID=40516 RepID=A0ABZ2U4T8_9ACTN|nr:MBL fold metallo-hydrolase [Gordonia hydrophobica]MBM7368224.1 glyoxylase-like metal-dependent hydrolase (beta-lactamase superfamily II) [Gordonia hydrophobica]
MADLDITTIDHGSTKTHLVHTAYVNWVILQSDDGVTLVDGGYPGHAGAVAESLRRVGSDLAEVQAALLTHAHVDHLGGLAQIGRTRSFPVYADPAEVPHARRDYLEQADASTIAPIAYRPRVMRWLQGVVRLGALDKAGIGDAQPLGDLSALPGAPVAVPAHGHTRGHSAFLAGDGEVLISGDSLISGHPTTKRRGPQCLDHVFTHDVPANEAAVATLADLDAVVLMPGHGPMLCGRMETFVAQALGS